MSWGIDFKADIFLSHISINSIVELEDLIKEKEQDIARYKESILMYASSSPKEITPEDWEEESINILQNQVNMIFVDYEETMNLLKDLYYYKEFLEDETKIRKSN